MTYLIGLLGAFASLRLIGKPLITYVSAGNFGRSTHRPLLMLRLITRAVGRLVVDLRLLAPRSEFNFLRGCTSFGQVFQLLVISDA